MSSPKNFQTQQNFTPYRLTNPKTTTSQLNSNQISQFNSHLLTQQKGKNNSHTDGDHLTSIHYQNNLLRQQNKALKRQINLIKGQHPSSKTTPTIPICNTLQINDLRQTIKKQAGQIKQLKTKLQVISKQCKMYQEIIDKMEGKINKLTQQNKNLQLKIKQYKQIQSIQKQTKTDSKNQDSPKTSKQRFNKLAQRINQLTSMYINLQEKVQQNQKQWELWKQKWSKQKYYYLNRIHDLQTIAGIGIETKQFYKKKF